MTSRCEDFEIDKCKQQCYQTTSEDSLEWMISIGVFKKHYCSCVGRIVRWLPDDVFLREWMKAIEEDYEK